MLDKNNLHYLRDYEFSASQEIIVSICTITYNHADFIEKCIENFLNQLTFFRIEIIIYDDASTDKTNEIIQHYAEKYPTIVNPILSKSNLFSLGVNPYYAFVFPKAKGKYIAICDGDDYWDDPEKLLKQVNFLENNPDTVITYGSSLINKGGLIQPNPKNGSLEDLSSSQLKTCPSINTLTACFRNPFLLKPPPYLRHSPIGDQTIWAILGHYGNGKFLSDLKPAVYRVHSDGIFSEQSIKTRYYMALLTNLCIAAYQHQQKDYSSENSLLFRSAFMIIRHLGTRKIIEIASIKIKSSIKKIIQRDKSF